MDETEYLMSSNENKKRLEKAMKQMDDEVAKVCDNKPSAFERLEYAMPDEVFTIADGFDDAVIGVCNVSMRVIYSYEKCLIILMENEAMTALDAIEWMDFNVINTHVGDKTPIWCMDNH